MGGKRSASLAEVYPDGPKWLPGFAALAIDPQYAPALLTVGAHE